MLLHKKEFKYSQYSVQYYYNQQDIYKGYVTVEFACSLGVEYLLCTKFILENAWIVINRMIRKDAIILRRILVKENVTIRDKMKCPRLLTK